MKKVCMIVPNPMVKGGIASVVNGYRESELEMSYSITYVESYVDGSRCLKLLKAIRAYFCFAKVLLWDRPDVVHIHSSFGPSFYRKLPFIYMSFIKKIPVINHIHGADFDEFYNRANMNKKKVIHNVYDKCSKLIALSQEWKDKLSMIVPEDKICIIENYSIIHESAYREREHRACNHCVLFLGELGRRKGCYDIPSVVENVVKKIPDVLFFLCGKGKEDDENAIRSIIYKKHLENNVVFPGWVRDESKDQVLKNADLFFLPSYNEGMPMSVLDAMGYGLPIVSTNVGGIPKIVQNGINGICCDPGNIDQFARCIIEILLDSNLRARYSEGSISIVNQGYSLKAHLDRLSVLYEEVLE